MGLYSKIKDWFNRSPRHEPTPSSLSEAPGSSGSGNVRDPKEIGVKKIGLTFDGASREAQPPEFDLSEIQSFYDAESYVRQACDKYIEFMFKQGWDFVGDNPATVEYLNQRLSLMAEMTQIPTNQMFIEIAEDLVKFSNAVVVKARDKENIISSVLPTQVQGIGGLEPVAGYFPLNMTTLKVLRDKNGTVKRWEQEVDGGDKPAKYRAEDTIHFYYKREKGKAFGVPLILPVLEDIRSLRQAEENVLKLIYRNLFPFIHAQVGTDDMPGTKEEVDSVQAQIDSGDIEAGLVTTERVAMSSVAADKIIDAEKYLRYFEQRVFSGLGVPELLMGRGNTANRSTGDNLASEFIERVKAYQRVMEVFVNDFMVRELLMEAGFDPLLNPQDKVEFRFREIDFDAKIKKENHAIFKYEHNSITEDEMRAELGLDPITDRALMHINTITLATMQAKASMGGGGQEGGGSSGDGKKATDNKNKPANQHGTKSSPKKNTNSSEVHLLELQFMSLLNDFSTYTEEELQNKINQIGILASSYAKNVEQNEQIHQSIERIFVEMAQCATYESRRKKLFEYESQLISILKTNVERGETT